MNNLLLYVVTVLIWGSTWHAITYQLGEIDPLLSVGYRFALASLVLVGYCMAAGKLLRFDARAHRFIFLQGLCLFGMNYWLIYLATRHLTSGLIAVVFSTVMLMNAVNGRIFLGNPVRPHVAVAGLVGLTGIVLVFWPELQGARLGREVVAAFVLAVAGTYLASLGNILSVRNQLNGLPVLQTNAFGMGYGALLMLALALGSGKTPDFQWTLPYVGSLLYLSLFGSIVAFGCYLTLVGRMGADRAAYASLLFPVVALQFSAWFEGYRWTTLGLAGLGMVVFGNLMIVSSPAQLKRALSRPGRG